MTDDGDWEFPTEMQPDPETVAFDLERTLSSVMSLRSEIPEDAFSAPTLGTERGGNGVVIGDNGLVLTIGYLITEAETVPGRMQPPGCQRRKRTCPGEVRAPIRRDSRLA